MALGETIRALRQGAGLTQEGLAERMEVSRQAVAKWEAGKSSPSTENLVRLAEVLGVGVEALTAAQGQVQPPAGQASADRPGQAPDAQAPSDRPASRQEAPQPRARARANLLAALGVLLGYAALYLLGRVLWCDFTGSSFLGWLWTNTPEGTDGYLFGWLLSSRLYWVSMAVSTLPAVFGKRRFSAVTLLGFALGLLAGLLFGPNPEGAAYGQGHFGWAIWGACFLLSLLAGALLERFLPKDRTLRSLLHRFRRSRAPSPRRP